MQTGLTSSPSCTHHEEIHDLRTRLKEKDDEIAELRRQLTNAQDGAPRALRWVHRNEYKTNGLVPRAQPWSDLCSSLLRAKLDIEDTEKGSNAVKQCKATITRVQRKMKRQCEYADHVLCQMAGGKPQRSYFMEYMLTKGPKHKEYQKELY